MAKYITNITFFQYQDNYKNGQFGKCDLSRCEGDRIFDSLYKAFLYLKEYWEENTLIKIDEKDFYKNYFEIMEDGLIVAALPMMIFDGFRFRCAKENEIEDWKDGKYDLYYCELQMKVKELKNVSTSDLNRGIKDEVFPPF